MSQQATFSNYALHPLGLCPVQAHERLACRGYNLWSGIASDIGEITLITAIAVACWRGYKLWKKHTECSVTGCKNHGHRVQGTPYRACHVAGHHPLTQHKQGEDVTPEHIAEAHAEFAQHMGGGTS